MAKKVGARDAVETVAPLDSCQLVITHYLATATNIVRGMLRARLIGRSHQLSEHVGIMRHLGVPDYLISLALSGRITSTADIEAAILTNRLLGNSIPPGINPA